MATQAYIIERERIIIAVGKAWSSGFRFGIGAAYTAIREASEAHRVESSADRNANRDHWGTLGVNASFLALHCPELREDAIALCIQLGNQSGLRDIGLI